MYHKMGRPPKKGDAVATSTASTEVVKSPRQDVMGKRVVANKQEQFVEDLISEEEVEHRVRAQSSGKAPFFGGFSSDMVCYFAGTTGFPLGRQIKVFVDRPVTVASTTNGLSDSVLGGALDKASGEVKSAAFDNDNSATYSLSFPAKQRQQKAAQGEGG
jgi:hypothetical protein